eukprot:gene13425-4294_t
MKVELIRLKGHLQVTVRVYPGLFGGMIHMSLRVNHEDKNLAYPLYPQSKEWVCSAGNVIYNVTLQGGIHAGKFRKIGETGDMNACSQYCCEDRQCDVAFMAKQNCYLVTCLSKNLCGSVPTQSPKLFPRLVYVSRTFFHANTRTISNEAFEKTFHQGTFGDVTGDNQGSRSPVKGDAGLRKNSFYTIDNSESKNLKEKLRLYAEGLDNPGTDKHFGQKNLASNSLATRTEVPVSNVEEVTVYAQGCYPAKVHKDVSLRYGTHSGEFYDYGEIGDMRMCVDLCCKDKKCDVAFMVGKTCYTISCSSFDFCQMTKASKTQRLTTQLAYVIKKRSSEGEKKLLISKNNEKLLSHQISAKSHAKSHVQSSMHAPTSRFLSNERQDFEIGTPKSEIFSSEEPNIPKKFTKGCRSNRILNDYGLIGGQRAGVYTLRGITPNFDACIGLCCAEMMCDAAFLLGRRCFSVQCFRNGACAGRPATSHGLRSKLAFVDRKDDDIGEKRASIPGLLPTDRQYTVHLNITSEDYKEGLRDHESLEFLNFAQAVRAAISGILGNVEGFKNIEILAFRPNKVIAIFNVTTDQVTHPKVLLQLIVDSLRKGEVKTFDEPVSGKLLLDVRGFKFLNSKGDNLVCSPEHNYDAHWPLAIFGTSVNIPCPRDAKGLSNRRCIGSEDHTAKWDVPDFSDCVSQKYEDLFKEAQLLNSASVHSPELTPASIIDRVLQLITTDTYGSNPPAAKSNTRSFYLHHHFRIDKIHQDPKSRGSLHTPEIESFRKLVAERRNQEKKIQHSKAIQPAQQKQKSPINLVSFFRGPTAKLIKVEPLAQTKPRNDDVKITSVSFSPNTKQVFGPKAPVPKIPNRIFEQNVVAQKSPGIDSKNSETFGISRQNFNSQPLSLPAERTPSFPNQKAFQSQFNAQQGSQGSIQNPRPASLQQPNQAGILRDIDRKYQQDFRKFNGNPKVDPSLLLSQGIWSKPQKYHAQTRSVPSPHKDVSGKVYHTLSLPVDVNQRMQENKWSFERKMPRKLTERYQTPTERSYLPSAEGQLSQPALHLGQTPELTLSYDRNVGKSLVNQDQLYIGPKTAVKQLNHNLNEGGLKYGSVNPAVYGNMQQLDGSKAANENRKNYVVSIRKKRSIDVDSERKLFLSSGANNGKTGGYLLDNVTKREAFGDYRKTDDRTYQDNLLESLTNEESDGDGLDQLSQHQSWGRGSSRVAPNMRVSGTAVATDVTGAPLLDDSIAERKSNLKESKEPFRLIEKTSYRPNEDSDAVRPIVVNLPLVNGNGASADVSTSHQQQGSMRSPVNQFVTQTGAQQGTSLDLDTSRMSLPDPRETSSYTEAHLDNPRINAVASAKIYHGDNPNSDGRTSTNIEITGVEGSPANGPAPQQEQSNTQNVDSTTEGVPPPKEQVAVDNEKEGSQPSETKPEASTSDMKGMDNEQKVDEQSQITTEDEKKIEEKVPENVEDIPTVPLENRNNTVDDMLTNGSKIENLDIPQVNLKKLTVNETEENAHKLASETQDSDRMFTFEKEHGANRAAMFGGDILLSADIFEELSNNMQVQTDAPSPQEIKEFLEAASSLLDEKNAREWKNAQRHLKVIANEDELNPGDIDVQDWKSLRKMQSKRKPNVLLEFVDDIEEYGKAASKMITKYNPVFQKPVITPNIIMEFRILLVEDLDDKQSDDNRVVFPNYSDPSIAKWSNSRDEISLPAYQLAESIQPTSTIHITLFLFKTVHKLQRLQEDMDDNDDQEVVDENPMKVGSSLISMTVDPPLPDHLRAPVSIHLQNTNFDPKAQHVCGFWNNTVDDWSTDGCNMVSYNETHTRCECDHLTTFGVLVDTSQQQEAVAPKPPAKPLPPPESGIPEKPSKKPAGAAPEQPPAVPPPAPPPAPPPPSPPPAKAKPSPKPSEATPTQTGANQGNKNKIVSSSGSGTSVGSELLVDKSRLAPKKNQGRSDSPSPRDSPGWLKLKSNAEHQDDNLMREKALLFSDYHQPYNFLTHVKERPNTSLESVYEIVSSSGSGTSVGSELLVDKSRLAPKKNQGRSDSPSPRDSPGWLKLKSNAEHQDDNLMREKALLFSDYHQPYNFLTHVKERPNTSLESVYGGSDVALPKSSASSSSPSDPLASRRVRPDPGGRPLDDSVRPRTSAYGGPKEKRNSYPPLNKKVEEKPVRNPPVKANGKRQGPIKNGGNVMPKNLSESGATSMEWDPYFLNTKKNEEDKRRLERNASNARKKSRNISPISEENTQDPEEDQPVDSVVPQVGSDDANSETPAVSESLYPLNTSDTSESATQATAAPQRRVSPPNRGSLAQRTSPPQRATPAQRASPPQKTTPPQRTSPPQRSSPPSRNSPPSRISPPQGTSPKNTSPLQRHPQRTSPRDSWQPSPRTSDESEKSDKHTQFSSSRR